MKVVDIVLGQRVVNVLVMIISNDHGGDGYVEYYRGCGSDDNDDDSD